MIKILTGDCRETLKTLEAGSVHTCVTSPPYWGLRDYGHAGQLGLEATPEEYVAKMVDVFREVKRALRDDGTLWLNLGDSYASGSKGSGGPSEKQDSNAGSRYSGRSFDLGACNLKVKDLVGIPWMVAFALRADGWFLRSDIIWAKPNPMPESCTDRPTKAHEYIFLLTKKAAYFYDHEAIKEAAVHGDSGSSFDSGKTEHQKSLQLKKSGNKERKQRPGSPDAHRGNQAGSVPWEGDTRNKRSVWTVTTTPFAGAHFATFPTELIKPCILAGTGEKGCCPKCGKAWVRQTEKKRRYDHTTTAAGKSKEGPYASQTGEGEGTHDIRHGICTTTTTTTGFLAGCACDAGPAIPCTVLDPFGGAGTTGMLSERLGRSAILCELNPAYIEIGKDRISDDAPLLNQVEVK